MMSGRSSRLPFTASQWQELEHQALIFKYMVSGMPIPPDLLFTIKTAGWRCFQMGLGRKVDPEPGRCRRTDGKKWRCSKEAFPDSKYCEKHMHRGKNRSRKPVETTPTSSAISNPPPSSSRTLLNPNFSSAPHPPIPTGIPHHSQFNYTHLQSHFLGHFGNGIELSPPQDNNTDPYCRKNRYIHGEDSRAMRSFSSCSSVVDDPLKFAPLTMSSPYSTQSSSTTVSEQNGRADYCSNDYLQLQGPNRSTELRQKEAKEEEDEEEEEKKGIHHFYDEWEPKIRDLSWPNTQLSISIPNSSHDDGLSFL